MRIDPPAAPGAMAPNLAVVDGDRDGDRDGDPGDDVIATWLEVTGARAGGASAGAAGVERVVTLRIARRSNTRGAGWSAPTAIAAGPKIVANWADIPSVGVAGDGALVAYWAVSSGDSPHAYDVVLARSTDGGRRWTTLGRPHRDGVATEHGFVSMAAEGDGARVFWLDGRELAAGESGEAGEGSGGAMTLRSAVVGAAGAAGASIGPEAVVDARVCDCCGTAAARVPGGALVVYRDRDADERRDIAAVTVTEGAGEASAPRPVADDGWRIAGCPVNGPALAVRDRLAVVAWYTLVGESPRVRAAFSTDAGERFGSPVDLDQPDARGTPIGRVDAVLDGDEAIVTWISAGSASGASGEAPAGSGSAAGSGDGDRGASAAGGAGARILARRVASDGRLGDIVAIAPTRADRAAGFPRAVRAGDQLIVAWTDASKVYEIRTLSVPLADIPRPAATGVAPR